MSKRSATNRSAITLRKRVKHRHAFPLAVIWAKILLESEKPEPEA